MSIFTPTSMYWNWVLTSGLIPTPPMPGWNEPVATGTRSPIFSVAFVWLSARTCGFWMILVFESLIRNATEALGILTTKSFDVRLASLFSVICGLLAAGVVVGVAGVPLALVAGVVVVVMLFCNVTDAWLGGLIPNCRILSRLTCMTATSTSTSGRA